MGGLTALMYAVQSDSALRGFLGAGLGRLLRYGSDPGVKSLDGRVPRDFCPDDASRTMLDSLCEGKSSSRGKILLRRFAIANKIQTMRSTD
jgi:hypothetical protein